MIKLNMDYETETTKEDASAVEASKLIIGEIVKENGIASADVRMTGAILGKFNSLVDYTEFKGRKSMCLRAYLTDAQFAQLEDLLNELSSMVHSKQITRKLEASAWPIKERVDETMPYPVIVARSYFPKRHKLLEADGEPIDTESVSNYHIGMGSTVNFVTRAVATTTNADHGSFPYVRFNLLGVRVLRKVPEINYEEIDI